ncbi:MAG: transporter associated domain-containing protein [Gammaproteobacteria bacterium]
MKKDRSINGSGNNAWLKRIRQTFSAEPQNREELISLLRGSQRHGLFDVDAQGMMEGVLQVADMQVRDIMIPRSQMVVVSRDESPEKLLPIIVESGHSRFPVVGEDIDEVIGVLLAKDLLRYCSDNNRDNFSLRDVLRPAIFIPESKRLNVLLKEFRASRNHMAIVVNEYGGVSGMVTIEDVLEQIVGEIEDEHDIDEGTFIRKYSDVNYTVKALTPIEEFNEYFKTEFSDEEFDTIGGLVIKLLGHLPKRGERLEVGSLSFQILRADNRRIHLLKVSLKMSIDTGQSQQTA